MPTEILKPSEITYITGNKTGTAGVDNIQFLNDGLYVRSSFYGGATYLYYYSLIIRMKFEQSVNPLSGLQNIEIDALPENDGYNISFKLLENGSEIKRVDTQDTASELPHQIFSFDSNIVYDKSGAGLEFEIEAVYGVVEKNGISYHYGWDIDFVEFSASTSTPSTIPPNIPTDLTPIDSISTTNKNQIFSAYLTDEEVSNTIKLVVEYSQDYMFSTGITTIESPFVSNNSTATATTYITIGTWYWRAKAVDVGELESPYTQIRSITITNTKPNLPTSLTPSNGSVMADLSPSFSASIGDNDNDAVMLEVEISKDSSFSNILSILKSGYYSNGDIATVDSPTLSRGNYYWRAKTYDGFEYSLYSDTMYFSLVNSNPFMSSYIPSTQAGFTVDNVDLGANVTDSDGDQVKLYIEVSQDSAFSTLVKSLSSIFFVSNTDVILNTGLLQNGVYYWRAYAEDNKGGYTPYSNTFVFYIEKPVSERIVPDQILENVNVNGTVSTITDDPDNTADSSWLLSTDTSQNSILRIGFMTPSNSLIVGAGLQEFKVKARTSNANNSGSYTIALYESGVKKSISSSLPIVASGTVVNNLIWDASLLTDKAGLNVECRVVGVGVYSGRPNERVAIEYGAIEWNATVDYNAGAVTVKNSPTATVTLVDNYKISDEAGVDSSTIRFTFDKDVTEWVVRVMGVSYDTGTLADSYIGSTITAGTVATAVVDWTELYQEGENRVNIYGKDAGDKWTRYESPSESPPV